MSPVHPAGASDGRRPLRRALVSVSDKSGIVELAHALHDSGVEIVSTGSTAALIAASGLPVTPVEQLTGFPESFDGRVKTLHPAVHGGLLADTRRPDHMDQLAELGIPGFDLLIANLYPFADTVAAKATDEQIIEQIDIGGPALIRGAAKNHASVAVIVDQGRYSDVYEAISNGGFTLDQRRSLAAAAFAHTAAYDVAVAGWFNQAPDQAFPTWLGGAWQHVAGLRYGENPHQRAALYRSVTAGPMGLADARHVHGKPMSYNNYVDLDAAVRAAFDHAHPAVAIIKHTNPCGIAIADPGVADPIAVAHARAHACDPISAFGGVVAANRSVTSRMAEQITAGFTEVIAAPGFDADALAILTARKNLRVLVLPEAVRAPDVEIRWLAGAMLVQDSDRVDDPGDDAATWRLVSGEVADAATLDDLRFAWRAVRAVKSNAILLAHDGASVGIGMGQVNRVDSCRLAVERAGTERAAGAVAASDAFFPFADGLQVLIDAGVRAVVQPGGSVRDEEVVAAAQAASVTMYLTGVRHFTH